MTMPLDDSQTSLRERLLHCRLTREEIPMCNYTDNLKTALSFNEYLVQATLDYWKAVSFPALYYAKFL